MRLQTELDEHEPFCLPVEAMLVRDDDRLYAEVYVPSVPLKEIESRGMNPEKISGRHLIIATPNGSLSLSDGESYHKPFDLSLHLGDKKNEIISSINKYPLGYVLERRDERGGYIELEIFRGASRVGYYVLHLK